MIQAEGSSFSPEIARQVVREQSWKELTSAWKLSTLALATPRSREHKLALVVLRAAVLDEMEAQQPQALPKWLARQHGGRRRG